MYRVLVCDDDIPILDSVEVYLKLEGYEVLKAHNGKEALDIAQSNEIHCIVMDIMMPVMDGMAATLKIREKMNIPIIMLSAKGEDTDKISGLNFGADDYITKPFNPLELTARVRSQIRRYVALGSMEKKSTQLVSGGLVLDRETKEVTVDGEPVRLTATEYGILEFLMENAGRVFSTDQIYGAVWNEPTIPGEKTVTVHIRKIREKIEIDPKNPKYLKVVWGIGYKIEKQ
ncbi:MAG: response regulator transcription factor [Clostridia bacterium]|nr:response regulator transcription factor [Clostridia bacterium]